MGGFLLTYGGILSTFGGVVIKNILESEVNFVICDAQVAGVGLLMNCLNHHRKKISENTS